MIFSDEGRPGKDKKLSYLDFVKEVVFLRPQKPASVMDVADLRFCMRLGVKYSYEGTAAELEEIALKQATIDRDLDRLLGCMDGMTERMSTIEAKQSGF